MRQILTDRIAGFDAELAKGQAELERLEQQRVNIVATVQRIQGARVVCQELLAGLPVCIAEDASVCDPEPIF